jgi:fluoride exporter
MKYLLVGLGGAIGSIGRFLIYHLALKFGFAYFPIGTFIVNVLGCFILGLLVGFDNARIFVHDNLRPLFVVGVLGGFTTFSTFGLETFELLRDGYFIMASINVFSSVILALVGIWGGIQIGRLIS